MTKRLKKHPNRAIYINEDDVKICLRFSLNTPLKFILFMLLSLSADGGFKSFFTGKKSFLQSKETFEPEGTFRARVTAALSLLFVILSVFLILGQQLAAKLLPLTIVA